MTEPIKLPPIPPEWKGLWDNGAPRYCTEHMQVYATLAVEQATAELRAEVDALKRRLGQHDACNGVMGESGYVPECISMRAEVERLREALDVMTAAFDRNDVTAYNGERHAEAHERYASGVQDEYAATRRAIVRAAAEIGREADK